MKLYCQKSYLTNALNNVSHALPARTTNKILEGILVEVKDNEMTFTSTDTNITVKTRIGIDGNGEADFVAPAKKFISIASKLPEEEVILEFDNEKSSLSIKSGKSCSHLITFPADEYPKVMVQSSENPISLNKESFRKMIRKTAFSASSDEMNGVLTGVLLEIKNKMIKMIAVDTFRLAVYEDPAETDENVSVIIPAKLLTESSKVIPDEGDDQLQLSITDNKVVMDFDNNRVVINTLNGNFINYEKIIRRDGTIKVRVKKEDLLASIDRASLMATVQTNNLIKWTIKEDTLEMNSLSEEGIIDESVEIIKEGEDLNIGFNYKYIMEILKVIDDEEIILHMKDSLSPCLITPLQGEKYLYLVLPVRLN